jgi:predicted HicB family RNase H-like nuclease
MDTNRIAFLGDKLPKSTTKVKKVVRSIRITKELDDRINILAKKGLITKNKWIVRTLTREAGLK